MEYECRCCNQILNVPFPNELKRKIINEKVLYWDDTVISINQKDSCLRFYVTEKLAILHSKLKNARNYYLHNITKKITDRYDIISCEKLRVKKMLKEHNLSKKISDASFHEIIRQLEYKLKYKNKLFYQIDEYYPSSQECNVCGNIDKKYKDLNERVYKCSNCGIKIKCKYKYSV